MRPRHASAIGMTLLALSSATPRAEAQSIIIGAPGVVNPNCLPFGCPPPFNNVTGYQQVFASSLISSTIAINQIDFFPSIPGNYAVGTYSISFAYTLLPVGGLSTNLPSNVSFGLAPFTSVALSGPVPATLSFAGTPFTYDPTLGNLLLDMSISGWTPSTHSSFLEADINSNCSRAFNGGFDRVDNSAADPVCLVTQLDYTVVRVTPEPATVALFATGLVGMAGIARRNRGRLRVAG